MPNRSSVIRMSRYRNATLRLRAMHFERVFSDNLADAAGVTSAQVRKDFSLFGITGSKRGGYKVADLLKRFDEILGKDKIQKIILVGTGNLGLALLHYPGFEAGSIKVVAGFDIDPNKQNPDAEIPIYPLEEMPAFIKKQKIKLGIIAVPDFAAQQVFELMFQAGIKGVLNFAPIRVHGSDECVIKNINMVTELESIIYFVNVAENTKE